MWTAHVEADTNEVLSIQGTDRVNLGKPLLALTTEIYNSCIQDNQEKPKWLDHLITITKGDWCRLVNIYFNSVTSIELYFEHDEYEFYKSVTPKHYNLEEFNGQLQSQQEAWISITELVETVNSIIHALGEENLPGLEEYIRLRWLEALEALNEALLTLAERGGNTARIIVE